MEELRSKRLKTRNLPSSRIIETKIDTKPYIGLIVVLMIAIACIMTDFWIFGLLLSLLCIAALIFVKNQCITELNEEFAVFYREGDPEECTVVYWDEIEDWNYVYAKVGLDYIKILMKNGEVLMFKSFSKNKLLKYFNRYAPKKAIEEDEDEE